MSVRDRLRTMQGAGAPRPDVATQAPHEAAESPSDSAADVSTAPRDAGTLRTFGDVAAGFGPERLLPGAECETPHGRCYVAEWRYPLSHRHGHAAVGATLGVSLAAASPMLARSARERGALGAVHPERVLYLDTETTGLAGGTGIYAFLVGVARFIGDELVVRQLFMRSLSEEHALLHALAQELAECDVLVTYNGKAFDWPLLETRFALGRRQGPRRPRDPGAHVDLLFAARRLWRGRLESCTLGQVERDVLGVLRGEDTPGWLIPQLYFTYLRSRDIRPLAGVFRHNTLDVLSLAALLGRVAAIGAGPASRQGATPADELVGLGRCLEDAGELERALACYERALAGAGLANGALRAAVVCEARMRAGLLLKRLRRASDAVGHWEALVMSRRPGNAQMDVRPYEELAKYYEHIARDRAVARTYVLAALDVLDAAPLHAVSRERKRLLHRLGRLDRVLASAR